MRRDIFRITARKKSKEGYFMFRFLNYYRVLGFVLFLAGLELTFRSNSFILLRYLGIFLLFVGAFDVITGRSMKASAIINAPMPNKASSTHPDDVQATKSVPIAFDKKNIIKSLLKKNAIFSIIILLAAVIIFKSSGSIGKKLFSYQDVNTKANVPNYFEDTGLSASKIEPVIETVNLSSSYLKNQVVIKINSIEKTPKGTYLNISIENNGKKSVQLTNYEKFVIVDSNNTVYNLVRSNCSYKIFDPIDCSSSSELKLAFAPCDSASKITKLKGQFWALDNGVQEVPFEIVIKK